MLHAFTSQLVSSLCIVACVEFWVACGLDVSLGCSWLLWVFLLLLVLDLFFWFCPSLFPSFLLLGVFGWGGIWLISRGNWFVFVPSFAWFQPSPCVFNSSLPFCSRRFLGITCFVLSSGIKFWTFYRYPFNGTQLSPFGHFQGFVLNPP